MIYLGVMFGLLSLAVGSYMVNALNDMRGGYVMLAGFCSLLFAGWSACNSVEDEIRKDRAREAYEQQLAQQQAAANDARYERERKAKEAAENAEAERKKGEERTRLEKLSKWQRVAAVRQCFKDDGVCPYGADFVVESARSPAESKQLKSLAAGLEKAERRRNAPLRCCDGTDSPSCTCGRPRRGCCSRHGGVCGCSD